MSLQEIMDEEFARQLAEKEYAYENDFEDDFEDVKKVLSPEELAIALSLQEIQTPNKPNEITQKELNSQLNFHIGNNRDIDTNNDSNGNDDNDNDNINDNNIDVDLDLSTDSDELLWDGILKSAGPNPTKHNKVLNSIERAKMVENSYNSTGNMDGVLLSSNAFKDLTKHQKNSKVKGIETHKKVDRDRYTTFSEVLDNETIDVLFGLEGQGIIDKMGGIISSGKEASVFYGEGHLEDISGDLTFAIKIHKTVLSDFKNRKDYILGDFRFAHTKINGITNRSLIKIWARKEYCNLIRIYNGGIKCPRPYKFRKHIIIMEFIGDDGKAAPLLRDSVLSKTQLISCYKQSVQILRDLYLKCRLIHGDYSEYNLIYHKSYVYVIDVGQSVEILHTESDKLLTRDCETIRNYFKDKIDEIRLLSVDDMIKYIKNKDIKDNITEYINQIKGTNDVDDDAPNTNNANNTNNTNINNSNNINSNNSNV